MGAEPKKDIDTSHQGRNGRSRHGLRPELFSIELARLVGKSGRVIASDLQEGMLQKLREKIEGTDLAQRITLHKCQEDALGLSEKVDFVLAFYMIHEVPDQARFFRDIASVLNPDGRILIVEPPLHVSRRAFEATLMVAQGAGLRLLEQPGFFSARPRSCKEAKSPPRQTMTWRIPPKPPLLHTPTIRPRLALGARVTKRA